MTSPLAHPGLTPRRTALVIGFIVLALGFVPLAAFWHFGSGDHRLPGLYSFRAAAVGDGLLLPVLAYGLARSAGLHLGWSRQDHPIIGGAAVLAALAGVLLQVQWLRNPRPRLNWTLPAPHHFNLPGWYHAGFLVAASGIFGGLAAATWLRLRREAAQEPAAAAGRVRSAGMVAVLAPVCGFTAVLLEDNTGALLPWPPIGAAVTGLMLAAALWFATGRRHAVDCLLASAAAAVPAAALAALLPPDPVVTVTTQLPVVAAALIGVAATACLGLRHSLVRLGLALLPMLALTGPVRAATSAEHLSMAVLAVGCLVGLLLGAVELVLLHGLLPAGDVDPPRGILRDVAQTAPILGLAAVGCYFGRHPASASTHADWASALVAIFLLGFSARTVRRRVEALIEAERQDAQPECISVLKWRTYTAAAAVYAAVALSFITFLIAKTARQDWVPGRSADYAALAGPAIALVAAGAVLKLVQALPYARLKCVLAALVCAGWAAVMIAGLRAGYNDWKQLALSVWIAAITGLFVAEGVISNTGYLHIPDFRPPTYLVGLGAGLAAASASAWMTGPAIASATELYSVPFALTALLVGCCGVVFLPHLAAGSLPGATPTRQYTISTPLSAVLQDDFMGLLLTLSVCWVPNFFLAHMPHIGFGAWLAVVIGYLALLSAAFIFIMRNNVEHFANYRELLTGRATAQGHALPADESQGLDRLARHLQRQNRIAGAGALVPLGIFLLFSEISGFDKKSTLKQLFKI